MADEIKLKLWARCFLYATRNKPGSLRRRMWARIGLIALWWE